MRFYISKGTYYSREVVPQPQRLHRVGLQARASGLYPPSGLNGLLHFKLCIYNYSFYNTKSNLGGNLQRRTQPDASSMRHLTHSITDVMRVVELCWERLWEEVGFKKDYSKVGPVLLYKQTMLQLEMKTFTRDMHRKMPTHEGGQWGNFQLGGP